MQASFEGTETRSHCAASRGDELRRQAEACRQLATSSLMERHKLVWLRLANEWLELARRADEFVVSPTQAGADLFIKAARHQTGPRQIKSNTVTV
jgi:anaerobic glycerol-3-phosphate dehydrogenase